MYVYDNHNSTNIVIRYMHVYIGYRTLHRFLHVRVMIYFRQPAFQQLSANP